MHNLVWCEHLDKRSKITVVDYRCAERNASLKIQSWYCPECGVHGAETELVQLDDASCISQMTPNEEIAACGQASS